MKVLVVEPQKPCRVQEINSLADMQRIVGGDIEAVYPFQEPVALVCNSEGKLLGLPMNRPLLDEDRLPYQSRTEETLADLMKQRTILNVRKKKRQALYDALADVEALAPAKVCYEKGLSGMEEEFARYMQAVRLLERCGVPSEHLTQEKTEVYNQLAELNRQIRAERKKLALCREIQTASKQMEEDIRKTETRGKEVEHDEHRRR